MRSMTGFGVGDARLGEGRVVVEVRSVNQRFLDVRARLPRELGDLTLFAEQVARERLRRGRVEIVVHTEGAVTSGAVLDKAKARAAFHALSELRDELAPGAEIPLALLASVPDLFSPPAGHELESLRAAIRAAAERAIEAMTVMCRREGEALTLDMRARCEALRRVVAEIAGRADGAHEAARRRLRDRIERLLADAEIAVDAGRLETEIAIIAERVDVSEEITRLGSHLDQFEAALAGAGEEPVGRRLDFLLQEMLREANTLGAKAQDAAISQQVVSIKVELERLREQVQNVE